MVTKGWMIPALLMIASTAPWAAMTCSGSVSTAPRSVMSATWADIRAPAPASAEVCSSVSGRTVDPGDPGTAREQLPGQFAAHPAARAGDDDDLACDLHAPASGVLVVTVAMCRAARSPNTTAGPMVDPGPG